METTFATVTLWIGLGLRATLAAWRLRISSALTEIVVGIAAAAIAARVAGPDALSPSARTPTPLSGGGSSAGPPTRWWTAPSAPCSW